MPDNSKNIEIHTYDNELSKIYEQNLENNKSLNPNEVDYFKSKSSYTKGYQTLNDKLQNLSILRTQHEYLCNEAGLAEIARSNEDLNKYAFHIYRQIEHLLDEIFFQNPGIKKIDELLNLPPCNERLFVSNYELLKNKFARRKSIVSLKVNINKQKPIINIKDKEIIFKQLFLYDLINNGYLIKSDKGQEVYNKKISGYQWPQLNAWNSIKYHRDKYAHARIHNELYIPVANYVDQFNINNPLKILDSNYYQSYLDTMLFLYSEYLKDPHF